jgi:hypothetical protein
VFYQSKTVEIETHLPGLASMRSESSIKFSRQGEGPSMVHQKLFSPFWTSPSRLGRQRYKKQQDCGRPNIQVTSLSQTGSTRRFTGAVARGRRAISDSSALFCARGFLASRTHKSQST